MKHPRWTDEDDQKAREMYADPSITIAQITAAFPGRTKTAIRNHCSGVKRVGQWTQAKTVELRHLASTGITSGEIAAKLLVTRNAVIGRCFRMGIRLGVNHSLPFTGHKKVKGKAVRDLALARTDAAKAAAAAIQPEAIEIPDAGEDWCRYEKNSVELSTGVGVGSMSAFATALVQARPSQCRFPVKDGMCQNKRMSFETSWCREHQKIVFVPPRKG